MLSIANVTAQYPTTDMVDRDTMSERAITVPLAVP